MESVSLKEMWMLLGEKDVQIYQLLKENENLQEQIKRVLLENHGHVGEPNSSSDGKSPETP